MSLPESDNSSAVSESKVLGFDDLDDDTLKINTKEKIKERIENISVDFPGEKVDSNSRYCVLDN